MLKQNNQEHRQVMLIPISAHGTTNPASAVMAGMKSEVVVKSDDEGHIDILDLKEKAQVLYKRSAGRSDGDLSFHAWRF